MPRGVSPLDEAWLQNELVGSPQILRPPFLVKRRGATSFSGAASFFAGPQMLSGQAYRVRYRLNATTGVNIRLRDQNNSPIWMLHALAKRPAQVSAIIFPLSSGYSLEADASVYTGVISDFVIFPEFIPPGPVTYIDRIDIDNVTTILSNRLPINGKSVTVTATVNKISGAEVRIANSSTDNGNVIVTSSGLPSGTSTLTATFTATSDYVAFGASGAPFSGSLSNIKFLLNN